MIVQAFLRWAETAKAGERARAANALGRVYLQSGLARTEQDAALLAMTYLLDDPSPRVRLALAEALAHSPESPRALMVSLAEDQLEIACTVIAHSPVLDDSDLVDIAGRGSSVTRTLVASRSVVSRMVSAAIIEIGDADEVLALLDNSGAAIAIGSLRRLSERHGDDCEIRNRLLGREDLPADARHRLMQTVGNALARLDLVRHTIGAARAERITRDAKELATVAIAGTVQHNDIPALVEHLRLDGRLTPAFIMHALCSGKVDFIAGVLANLSGLEDRRVRAILSNGRMHAVRALYESSGIRRDISPVFVEATLLLRKAARAESGTILENISGQLLKSFNSAGHVAVGIAELMGMVEKLNMAEQRQSARSYASSAVLAA